MVPIWKGLIRMTITACKKGQKCFEWFIPTCKICWGQCIREHPWESPDQIIEFFLKFLLLEWKSKKKQIQVYWYKTGWHSVGRYPIWFNSMFEFCQKMVHSIFDSILLYPRFNSKYYSIKKNLLIQFKRYFNSIVKESLILVKSENCPKSAQKVPKIDKKKGDFHQKCQISIQNMIHSFISR